MASLTRLFAVGCLLIGLAVPALAGTPVQILQNQIVNFPAINNSRDIVAIVNCCANNTVMVYNGETRQVVQWAPGFLPRINSKRNLVWASRDALSIFSANISEPVGTAHLVAQTPVGQPVDLLNLNELDEVVYSRNVSFDNSPHLAVATIPPAQLSFPALPPELPGFRPDLNDNGMVAFLQRTNIGKTQVFAEVRFDRSTGQTHNLTGSESHQRDPEIDNRNRVAFVEPFDRHGIRIVDESGAAQSLSTMQSPYRTVKINNADQLLALRDDGVAELYDLNDGTLTFPLAGISGVNFVDINDQGDIAFAISGTNSPQDGLYLLMENNPPVAVDDSAVSTVDAPILINVLLNDFDPDGQPLTVTAVTQAANGTVANLGSGLVSYTRNPGFNGTDSFTYTISDNNGGFATGSVSVQITPDLLLGENVVIGPNTSIGAGTTIGNNVTIGANSTIGINSTLHDGVTLGDGARLGSDVNLGIGVTAGNNLRLGNNVTVQQSVQIGNSVRVGDRTVIGKEGTVGDTTTIGSGAVIQKNCQIGAGVTIGDRVILKGGTVVPDGTTITR